MHHDETLRSRRATLYAKRDQLRAAQASDMERRRRAALEHDFERWHGSDLAAAGVQYRLLWDWEAAPPSPIARYPCAVSGIDWRLVPGGESRDGHTRQEQCQLLRAAVEALQLAPHKQVHIEWDNAAMPQLVLPVRDLLEHAERLLRGGSDMWVVCPGEAWVIEIYHEGTVSFAVQPPPDDAAR